MADKSHQNWQIVMSGQFCNSCNVLFLVGHIRLCCIGLWSSGTILSFHNLHCRQPHHGKFIASTSYEELFTTFLAKDKLSIFACKHFDAVKHHFGFCWLVLVMLDVAVQCSVDTVTVGMLCIKEETECGHQMLWTRFKQTRELVMIITFIGSHLWASLA